MFINLLAGMFVFFQEEKIGSMDSKKQKRMFLFFNTLFFFRVML
jgi:hypothetical protein